MVTTDRAPVRRQHPLLADVQRTQAYRASRPAARQLVTLALAGAMATAAVGYVVSENPHAAPAHVAVPLRVALIVMLMAGGIYGLADRHQPRRMAILLVLAGCYACVWLLNGAGTRVPFTIGVLASGLAPTAVAFLILAYPTGLLRARAEQLLLIYAGGTLLLAWGLLVFTSHAVLATPLIGRRHPSDLFSFLNIGSTGVSLLRAGVWLSWATVVCGTALLVSVAQRGAPARVRRLRMPVVVVAWAWALSFLAFFGAYVAGSPASSALGAASVETVLAIPFAILTVLGLERVLMGRALARFVARLATQPGVDLQVLLAGMVDDPSLVIAYPRPAQEKFVDASGAPVDLPFADRSRTITWIEPAHGSGAAVIYDTSLADRAAFIQAAAAAAALRMEAEQLEAELKASITQLAASRLRLLEAADAERQRIERDLHDGIQQQIVGLRLKLELASEAINVDHARGERMLVEAGRDLDNMLGALRALTKGIYPPVLKERGLREAVMSATLNLRVPVTVAAVHTGRYREETEVAVYFCCVEAIQNVVKHAGPEARAEVRVWQSDAWLRFAVRDFGVGFDADTVRGGSGMINMKDRIEAVGGTLEVISHPGRGTTVLGRVPATPPDRPLSG